MKKFLIVLAYILPSLFIFAGRSNAETLIRFFNCDDECKAFVNGNLVLVTPLTISSSFINIDAFLTKPLGQNTILIQVSSIGGGQTYGYEIVKDNQPIVSAQCGTVLKSPCGGQDLGNVGLVYQFSYKL